MSIVSLRPDPARDHAEAVARFAKMAARDGAAIASAGRSRALGPGRRTARSAVFVHGFTNCPQQWIPFACELVADGWSAVIPRLPGHGYFDRATRAPARVSAADLLETVSDAIDVACGMADRVDVVGLSIGGTIAPWLAQHRSDVARVVALVPFFAVKRFDAAATRRLTRALAVAPNAFVPWDPFGDGSHIPAYGYPKFSTRLLGRCLAIGTDVADAARTAPASGVTYVLNANEPACENAVSSNVAGSSGARLIVWDDLPANHDIIDPTNPAARTDLVYPRVRALLEEA